jgi:hypothetical protein
METAMTFNKWLDTLVSEKGIDTEQMFSVEGPTGTNWMCYRNVLDSIKNTSKGEQKKIKDMIVRIDFQNGDVKGYFRHLAQAIAL